MKLIFMLWFDYFQCRRTTTTLSTRFFSLSLSFPLSSLKHKLWIYFDFYFIIFRIKNRNFFSFFLFQLIFLFSLWLKPFTTEYCIFFNNILFCTYQTVIHELFNQKKTSFFFENIVLTHLFNCIYNEQQQNIRKNIYW